MYKLFTLSSLLFFILLLYSQKCSEEKSMTQKERVFPNSPIDFSQNMLLAIKSELPYKSYVDTLERMDLKKLEKKLISHNEKLSFWINTYNSLVQVRLMKHPSLFKDKKKFFETNDIIIGYQKLSLNDIENGIMRLKKEVTNKPFVSRFKVGVLDNRIHFTLNCGATSCPAIAYYSPENLDTQLEEATSFYVSNSCSYNKETNEVLISELFSWFKEDFNGDKGVLELLKTYGLFPKTESPTIKFTPYDWGVKPANFN